MELGGQLAASQSESAVVLETGTTADLVCYKRLGNRHLFSGKQGFAEAAPYTSAAQFKFGDGRIGEVKRAADFKVVNAGCQGAFAKFVLGAEIPALLRKGALEALGAQLDFEKDTLPLLRHGVCVHGAFYCQCGRVWPRAESCGLVLRVVVHGEATKFVRWRIASATCGERAQSFCASPRFFSLYGRDLGRCTG